MGGAWGLKTQRKQKNRPRDGGRFSNIADLSLPEPRSAVGPA